MAAATILAATSSTEPAQPLWETVLIGLGGAIIGAATTTVGQVFAARAAAKTEAARQRAERASAAEERSQRMSELAFDTRRLVYAKALRLARDRRDFVKRVSEAVEDHDLPTADDRWKRHFEEVDGELDLLSPTVATLTTGVVLALERAEALYRDAEARFAPRGDTYFKEATDTIDVLRYQMRTDLGIASVTDAIFRS